MSDKRDSGTCRKQQKTEGTLSGTVRWRALQVISVCFQLLQKQLLCWVREPHPSGKTEPLTSECLCDLSSSGLYPEGLKKFSIYKLGFYTTVLISALS